MLEMRIVTLEADRCFLTLKFRVPTRVMNAPQAPSVIQPWSFANLVPRFLVYFVIYISVRSV